MFYYMAKGNEGYQSADPKAAEFSWVICAGAAESREPLEVEEGGRTGGQSDMK